MAPLLLFLVLTLMLVVLANLGQLYRQARWLTYAVIAALSLLALFTGSWLLFFDSDLPANLLGPGFDVESTVSGLWIALSGGITLLAVLFAVTAYVRKQDPHLGRFYWSRPVHLTALALIVFYAGGNLAYASVLEDPSILGDLGFSIGVGDVLVQYASFVALSLIGVGLGIRRNWRESQARLRVNRLGLSDIGIAWAFTIFMVFLSFLLGGIVTLLFPDSTADASAFNQIITEAFSSPGGAILLGLLSGVGEEILYRGALQAVFGLWLTSLIFAVHHIQYLNPTIVLIFLLGLVLGWIRNRWGTSTAALVHASYNAALILLSLAALQVAGS